MVIPYLIYAIILAVAAALPTLAILIWLLSGERGRRERWQDVLYIFFLGAFVSAFVALILESLAIFILSSPVLGEYDLFARDPTALTFLVSIVIAPFVEEFAKLLIVLRSSNRIWRPRNGLVFGAAVGLGFSATENFLYGIAALTTAGIIVFLALIMSRTFSSTLMHASASSISGYGVAKWKIYSEHWWPYYAIAVLIHASFNLFASFGELFYMQLGPAAGAIGLFFAVIMAIATVMFIRSRIGGFHA